jgi:hypothetical protein
MDRAYIATGEDVQRFFEVDKDTGLSDAQIEAARVKYGRNGLVTPDLALAWHGRLRAYAVS